MIPSIQPFRKKQNWLAAVLVELLAPALRRYALRQTSPALLQPAQWKKALILGDNHIGDLLYRTCSLRALKSGLPGCDFYYLAAADTADILAGNPFIREVLPWARSDSRLDITHEHMQQLKNMHFDAALCTNCIRYWPELLLAIRLGIPNRAGYTYKGFSGWVTRPIPIRYPKTFAGYFRDYVADLTGQVLTGPLRPELYLTRAGQEEADMMFKRLGLPDPGTVIACFVTSRQDTALWKNDSFRALFRLISEKPNRGIVLLGAPGDLAFLNQMATTVQRGESLPVCTSLSLPGLAAFLKRCSLVLAKDSGPRHIANAVGTPVLFFRSLSFSQAEAGPYCPGEVDLVPPGQFLSRSRQDELLDTIEPSKVMRHIDNALKSRT